MHIPILMVIMAVSRTEVQKFQIITFNCGATISLLNFWLQVREVTHRFWNHFSRTMVQSSELELLNVVWLFPLWPFD